MKTVERVAEVRCFVANARRPVALVPTMGYLHEGHLSLMERARAESETVVASVFVNPTQFGPHEDFERYPRDLESDLRKCEAVGVDLVFAPPIKEVYPPGDRTVVEVLDLQDRWEGASRPGHLRGVATVVAKLFRIVLPDRAYFGEKDYQQLQIVRRLATDLMLDVDVIGCPIVREPDGLAMSSRNVYLDPEQRRAAPALFAALRKARTALSSGELRSPELVAAMADVIAQESTIALDYAAVVDPITLDPVEIVDGEARALIAARIGSMRLIDNMELIAPDAVPGLGSPG